MTEKRKQTEHMLIAHYQTYPQMQIRDMLKFLHQSACGCEHFVSNEEDAIKYIASEAQNTGENIAGETTELCAEQGGRTEPLDGEFCRVHLSWIKAGLAPKTLGRLFVLSAEPAENGKEVLEEKVAVFQELVNKGRLPFDPAETGQEIAGWREAGYPPCRHTEHFRSTYVPAYRVIKKEYAMFLPLFLEVDRRRNQSQNVTLAIEGGSASGKTTLSKLLEAVYSSAVLHMDDFFLRPQQRTPERLAQPGGNVDWERFLEEVLTPLKKRDRINYRRFDCSTFTIKPPVPLTPTKLTVVEGAYSMHPQLEGHYDLSVFLDVSPKLQEARIRKRNVPAMAERFFREWIPMERHYFEATDAKNRCDLVIEVSL